MTPDGKLGPEVSRDSPDNIQRECEVEVLMSMSEAQNLYNWIGDKIDEWREADRNVPQGNSPEVS